MYVTIDNDNYKYRARKSSMRITSAEHEYSFDKFLQQTNRSSLQHFF